MSAWDEALAAGWHDGTNAGYWKGERKVVEPTLEEHEIYGSVSKPNDFHAGNDRNGIKPAADANGFHDENEENEVVKCASENFSNYAAADPFSGEFSGDARNHDGGDAGQGRGDACRNCSQEGHFARECPEPSQMSGECFNCGEVGHNKADCTNPKVARPFRGICRVCGVEGHPGSECPDKPAEVCRNCKEEGHKAQDCEGNRALDYSNVPDVDPEAAWMKLILASNDRDIDDFKKAIKMFCKSDRDITYDELERRCRAAGLNIFLIALEKDIPKAMTIVNLQGKNGCKYVVGYYFSPKPKRAKLSENFPSSPEENLERLMDAGVVMEHVLPLCRNCEELGHVSKNCPEEKIETPAAQEITCNNCNETGHRQRDCAKPRQVRGGCKNCGSTEHKVAECTEPRSAEGVECRRCNEIGHFSKDCPSNEGGGGRACRNCGEEGHISRDCEKPKNPAMLTCRNCDETGHFSRDCPKPRDYSRVKCQNCGEMGHTVVRCKQPVASDDNAGGGGVFEHNAGDDSGNAGPEAEAPTGDWAAASSGGGW